MNFLVFALPVIGLLYGARVIRMVTARSDKPISWFSISREAIFLYGRRRLAGFRLLQRWVPKEAPETRKYRANRYLVKDLVYAIALMVLLSAVAVVAFGAEFALERGAQPDELFGFILGLSVGLSIAFFGFMIIIYTNTKTDIITSRWVSDLTDSEPREPLRLRELSRAPLKWELTMAKEMEASGEKIDFEGKIVRRDKDGFGVVEFIAPFLEGGERYGFFTEEVIQSPTIEKQCDKGAAVHGRAERFGDGYKILRMEPS